MTPITPPTIPHTLPIYNRIQQLRVLSVSRTPISVFGVESSGELEKVGVCDVVVQNDNMLNGLKLPLVLNHSTSDVDFFLKYQFFSPKIVKNYFKDCLCS